MPEIEYFDLKDSGIRLIPPSAPEFQEALPAFRPIHAFSALLHNGTGAEIMAVSVRYEIRNAAGEPIANQVTHGTLMDDTRTMIAPGDLVLITPERCRRLRGSGSDSSCYRTFSPPGQDTDVFRSQLVYEQQERIRLVVDSVVFRDGTIIGPDQNGTMEKINGLVGAERDLLEAILTAPPGTVASVLARATAGTDGPPSPEDRYAIRYRELADMHTQHLQAVGEEKFVESMRQVYSKPRVNPVRRGMERPAGGSGAVVSAPDR